MKYCIAIFMNRVLKWLYSKLRKPSYGCGYPSLPSCSIFPNQFSLTHLPFHPVTHCRGLPSNTKLLAKGTEATGQFECWERTSLMKVIDRTLTTRNGNLDTRFLALFFIVCFVTCISAETSNFSPQARYTNSVCGQWQRGHLFGSGRGRS